MQYLGYDERVKKLLYGDKTRAYTKNIKIIYNTLALLTDKY